MYEEKMRSDGKISTILTYTMKSFYTNSNLNLTDMNCDIEKTIQIKNAKWGVKGTFGVSGKVTVGQDGDEENEREDQDDAAHGDAAAELVGATGAASPRRFIVVERSGANPDGDVIAGAAVGRWRWMAATWIGEPVRSSSWLPVLSHSF